MGKGKHPRLFKYRNIDKPGIDLDESTSASFIVYNLIGEQLTVVQLSNGINAIGLDKRYLNGVYLFRIEHQGKLLKSGKIMVNR